MILFSMTSETVALVLGDRHVSISVVRSARRTRTLTISVDPFQGVRVLVPAGTARSEIESLVTRQASWIAARLQQDRPVPQVAAIPELLPYLGRPLQVTVREAPRPALVLDGDAFTLHLRPGSGPAAARDAIDHFFGTETVRLVNSAVARFSPLVGREPTRVIVREQKRRWGSCAADGSLRLNLRLSTLAPDLVDYVVVHELCHLIHRNHSPAFWAEVARVLPDQRELRTRLRKAERELPTW